MKTKFRTVSSLWLAAALLFSSLLVLTACGGSGESPVTSGETGEQTEPQPDVESIPLLKGGKPQIRIIRPDDTTDAVITACRSIMETLGDIGSENPAFKSDFIRGDEKHDPETYEILVGFTNYDETTTVVSSMHYNDYCIRIVGHKIVLAAFSDKYITFLANTFNSYCRKNITSDGNLSFGTDGEIAESISNALSALPVMDGANPSASENSDTGAFQILFEKRSLEDYQNYVKKIEESGLEKVSSRDAVGNYFSTFKNDKYAVTAYYRDSQKLMRLITEPAANLFVQDANSYQTVTTPKLVMIGDLFDSEQKLSGLECMILQLSDGRFIVVDGGVASNGFSDKIYQVMVMLSDGKPDVTVAAWFISHSHNDHTGGFVGASLHYHNHIKVEKMFFNFIDSSVSSLIEAGGAAEAQKVYNTLNSYYPDTAVYKCHSGQVYQIADARIEVLYTPDDYLRSNRNLSQTKNFNNTSMIFSVEIAGQKIMFLGDAQETANNETAQAYGGYLKSEIVQIAHHAGAGGTVNIYKQLQPVVALVTTDDSRLGTYLSTDFNQQWVKSDSLMEYWNAHNRITLFDLPYRPTEKSGFRK